MYFCAPGVQLEYGLRAVLDDEDVVTIAKIALKNNHMINLYLDHSHSDLKEY